MNKSGRRLARWSAVLTLALPSIGCQAPSQPVPTVWQGLGIPQAATRLRDGIANRTGNRPGLERKPPVLRLADEKNLESPNEAIKAAAEIKQQEDLKPQKLKALKYLATIGCGCYDKEGKVEKAILAALDDCTQEVRVQAVETVIEAAGTCKCRYDGCSPSCCTPDVVKKLYDMAYEVDDKGCPLEPSAEVRKLAAKAVCSCAAVNVVKPAEEEEEEEKKEEKTEELEEPGTDGDDESLDSPTVSIETYEGDGLTETMLVPAEGGEILVGSDHSEGDYWQEGSADLAAPAVSTGYEATEEEAAVYMEAPEDMVVGLVSAVPESERVVLQLDNEYDIREGEKLLLLSVDGRTTVSKILAVDGTLVEVGSKDLAGMRLATNANIFVGLVAN